MKNSSIVTVSDARNEEDKESEDGTFADLITTDVFSWNWISKYCSNEVNRNSRVFGNLFQTIVMFLLTLTFVDYPTNFVKMAQELDESFVTKKLNCSRYYLFDFKNFSYYEIGEETNNATIYGNDCRLSTEVQVLTFLTSLARTLICMIWLYTCDRRFGALKFGFESLTIKLREKHLCIQLLVVVGFFPVNMFLSAILSIIALPVLFLISSLNIILKLFVSLKTKETFYTRKTKIDHCMSRVLKDRSIVILYLLFQLQRVISMIIFGYFSTIGLLRFGEKVFFSKVTLQGFAFQIYLIYLSFQIYKARNHYQPAISTFKGIFPFLTSLWNLADIVTDLNQLMYYKNLANSANEFGYKISVLYLYFSIGSFVWPVVCCFLVIIYNKKGFIFLSERFKTHPCLHSNRFSSTLLSLMDIIIGIALYFCFAIIVYCIIIPIIITKHGLDILRKGEDEERFLDWDPFRLVSTHTSSKGILEFFGFPNLKSKYLPLITCFEPLHEASIQTVLSIVFLCNNLEAVVDHEAMIGLPILTTPLTLLFSILSLSVGIYRASNIIISTIRSFFKRFSFEDL